METYYFLCLSNPLICWCLRVVDVGSPTSVDSPTIFCGEILFLFRQLVVCNALSDVVLNCLIAAIYSAPSVSLNVLTVLITNGTARGSSKITTLSTRLRYTIINSCLCPRPGRIHETAISLSWWRHTWPPTIRYQPPVYEIRLEDPVKKVYLSLKRIVHLGYCIFVSPQEPLIFGAGQTKIFWRILKYETN